MSLSAFQRDASLIGEVGRSDGELFSFTELLQRGLALVLEDLVQEFVRLVCNGGHVTNSTMRMVSCNCALDDHFGHSEDTRHHEKTG
jgi:hypothetical protein